MAEEGPPAGTGPGLKSDEALADARTREEGQRLRCLVLDCGGVTNPDSNLKSITHRRLQGIMDEEECAKAVKEVWKLARVDAGITKEAFWSSLCERLQLDTALVPEMDAEVCAVLGGTFTETLELAKRAQENGFVIGMISNHVSWWFQECALAAQLGELIDSELIVVSSEVGCGKPDAQIFEVFLGRLARLHPNLGSADCVFVDDKVANIEAAQALGFQGVHFCAPKAAPGELEQKLAALGLVIPSKPQAAVME